MIFVSANIGEFRGRVDVFLHKLFNIKRVGQNLIESSED
jgi:hypothetical protein